MNTGRKNIVFVNKTGGGITVNTIIPSGYFKIVSVISPTGTTTRSWVGMWLNHEEKITINVEMSSNLVNFVREGTVRIDYRCEDNSLASHLIPVIGSSSINGYFPSRVLTTIAFYDLKPRAYVLDRDNINLLNGYPVYKHSSGKVYMYARKIGHHLYWTFNYNGRDWVYHTHPMRNQAIGRYKAIGASEAVQSFPLDCSYFGNTYHNWGEDTSKRWPGPYEHGPWHYYTGSGSTLGNHSYMGWKYIDGHARNRVRLFFFQNIDTVGWRNDPSALSDGFRTNIKSIELRTDKNSDNRIMQFRTDYKGNRHDFCEWLVHLSNGKAHRFVTQAGNFDVDVLKLGFGNPGQGRLTGYARCRRLQIRRESDVASESSQPSSWWSRMGNWSSDYPLPYYNFGITKNGVDNGRGTGWAAGRLTARGLVYQDCGNDTKYTINRTSSGETITTWYDEGVNGGIDANWGAFGFSHFGSKPGGQMRVDTPQGSNVNCRGHWHGGGTWYFRKSGIPVRKWRISCYLMCVATWDREQIWVNVNGKRMIDFNNHMQTSYNIKTYNGASYKKLRGRLQHRSYKNRDWHFRTTGDSIHFTSGWITDSTSCNMEFQFQTNQGAWDEHGLTSHVKIEYATSDVGFVQPLVDINRYVVMGVNQYKQGILRAGSYKWNLKRGVSGTNSQSGSFSVSRSSRTSNSLTYIRDTNANWGGVGVDKGTYFTGWQCCESSRGLGNYCNLYRPEDAIKEANGWGINETRTIKARADGELYHARHMQHRMSASWTDNRTHWDGTKGNKWYYTSEGISKPSLNHWSSRFPYRGGWNQCSTCGREFVRYAVKSSSRAWWESDENTRNHGGLTERMKFTYSNPTIQSLRVEMILMQWHASDDAFAWNLHIYDNTNKQVVCDNPKVWKSNGLPPGAWGGADATVYKTHFKTNDTPVIWRSTIPPKTSWTFKVGAAIGRGWCQNEGGYARTFSFRPVAFV